jgi:hypothetical protein
MHRLIILFLGIFLLSGCGYVEGTIQKAEGSYIVFLGELDQVKVQIDSTEPFTPSAEKHYQLSPGKHTVTAFRNESQVLKRIIILENNVITEVRIP